MGEDMSKLDAQRERLYEEFTTVPPVELTGVVSSTGVVTGNCSGPEDWNLRFTLDAWRVDDGPVQTDELTVRRRVTDDEVRVLLDDIDAETIIRLRARFAEDTVMDSPQAMLETVIETDVTDAALEDHIPEPPDPETFVDETFGTFVEDSSGGRYTGTVEWDGTEVELTLTPSATDGCASVLAKARELWADQSSWSDRVTQYAVDELLELKNTAWVESDAENVSAPEFRRRMELKSIDVRHDGEFTFWHYDNDLFFGHSIMVCGSLSDGLTRVDIPG